jgi:hypothetical protein
MDDAKFADGIYFNKKNDNAPDFIIGSVNFHPDRFIPWLKAQKKNDKGYVKTQIKISKGGSIYFELDTWQPTVKPAELPSTKEKKAYEEATKSAPDPSEIPF